MSDPIAIALAEDIGSGDVTCEFFVSDDQRGKARIVAREKAIAAGVETAREVFTRVDSMLSSHALRMSGSSVAPGDAVLEVVGAVKSIITAERVALNFLQRLSGIATMAGKYVEAVAGTRAVILDTRKTTPGLRTLEKAAVVAGGAQNHRFGLYDMVLVKDNHLAAARGGGDLDFLQHSIDRLKAGHPDIRVELEADTIDQVRGFLTLKDVDMILLDNMTEDQLREAVALGDGRMKFEASGGVTLDTVRKIAATGVDFISVGALTHSARAIDFSLELVG